MCLASPTLLLSPKAVDLVHSKIRHLSLCQSRVANSILDLYVPLINIIRQLIVRKDDFRMTLAASAFPIRVSSTDLHSIEVDIEFSSVRFFSCIDFDAVGSEGVEVVLAGRGQRLDRAEKGEERTYPVLSCV